MRLLVDEPEQARRRPVDLVGMKHGNGSNAVLREQLAPADVGELRRLPDPPVGFRDAGSGEPNTPYSPMISDERID